MTCSSCPGSARTAPSVGAQGVLELDVLADEAVQHLVQRLDDLVEAQHLRLEHLLAAEGEQLPGERRRPQRGRLDLLDVGALGVLGAEVLEQQVAVAGDGREEVVEVVRDAAGEPAHGLDPLRLAELGLERPVLGHVHHHALVHYLPIGRGYGVGRHLHGDEGSVLALPLDLRPRRARVNEALPRRRIRVDVAGDVQPHQFFSPPVAQHPDQGRVHGEETPLGGRAVDADGGVLDQAPKLGLRPPQLLRRPVPIGDVFSDAHRAHDAIVAPTQQGVVPLDLAVRAVAGDDRVLEMRRQLSRRHGVGEYLPRRAPGRQEFRQVVGAQDLIPAAAGQFQEEVVAVRDPAVRVQLQSHQLHPVEHRPEALLRPAQRLLRLLALA